MECQKKGEQTAYPVFYDVEPSEIRKQNGAVGEAFVKHEMKEAVGKWREALNDAADLAGWELKNTANGHEAKFIQKIVEEISLELRSIDFNIDGKLIGMETRVRDVVSSLEIGVDDVRMIGVKGIGGGGKTTLARAVFDQISFRFEGKSFIENVREVSKASSSGLKKLQKQVLQDVLNGQDVTLSSVHDGKNMIKKMMCGRKVLVVLDDVDHIDQLEALAGDPNWFKSGSRIIITTRDEQVLVAHRVNLIRDVNLLSDNEALCLLRRHAFGREIPIQGYEELSGQVVRYAAGLPLTIRVLGSFLCGKNELEWKDAIERLKTIPLKETLQKLELSYTGLEEDYKEIFLDVACILKGWSKDKAITVLESRGFHARNGLRVLEQKSLITISYNDECLGMHDHLEEMGMNIVRRLHPDKPYKHSRLWIVEEIEDILANDLGTNATRCIKWDTCQLAPEILMKGFGSMEKLTFLHVDTYGIEDGGSNWKFDEDIQYFPNALRYLSLIGYPFRSLPKTFQANNLVGLEIKASEIVQLWDGGGKKVLNKLRFIDIGYTSCFKTFDLGHAPNLETLSLSCCDGLVEFHMPAGCSKLKSLDLCYTKLRTLDVGHAPNLETINLSECYELVEFHMPVGCSKLEYLDLSFSKLRTLDLGHAPNLEILNLRNCNELTEFHLPFKFLKLKSISLGDSKLTSIDLKLTPNLETLSLGECWHLLELHMLDECLMLKSLDIHYSKLRTLDLRGTPNLEMLSLEQCVDLVQLHMPDGCLKLKSLDINYSKLRILDLGGTRNLKKLRLKDCVDLVQIHMPIELLKLQSISLGDSKLTSVDLRLTPNLETLSLGKCYDLLELHMPNEGLMLKSLDIHYSKLRTLDLRGTPNLETLCLKDCVDLVQLHMPDECLKLKFLDINHSKLSILNLGGTPNLEKLCLKDCVDLVEFHVTVECTKLRSLDLNYSKLRTLDLMLTPNLERLYLTQCYHLLELHAPIHCLKNLVYLGLSDCLRYKSFVFEKMFLSVESGPLDLIEESLDICPLYPDNDFPKLRFTCSYKERVPLSSSIGNLENLISIGLGARANLKRFSQNNCAFQCLTKLIIDGGIIEVLMELDQLPCLEELSLLSTKINHLLDNICTLKHLTSLQLKFCWFLEKLTEDLGRLESLKELILSDCMSLRDVPDNICKMKQLEYLHVRNCILVEKLPEELGRLECLKELNIEGTSISHLPRGISLLKGLSIIGFTDVNNTHTSKSKKRKLENN